MEKGAYKTVSKGVAEAGAAEEATGEVGGWVCMTGEWCGGRACQGGEFRWVGGWPGGLAGG